MSDYPSFDLDVAIAQAWDAFADRLAEVVENIDETGALTIDAAEGEGAATGGPWIRYSQLTPGVMRLEAASNNQLGEADQLGLDQLTMLEVAGFVAPGEGEPPSLCFHVDLAQEESTELARLGVVVLRDVYTVLHPAFLAPDQLAEILTQREEEVPAELKHADPDDIIAVIPRNRAHLDAMISNELTQIFGHTPLIDEQGDHAFRVGTTMVFVRAADDCKEIVVFSVVVHDVDGRSRAVEVLNDINTESRFVRFELIRDRVFVQMSVLSQPFVPIHLHQAVRLLSQVADGVDVALAERLHGRTTFPSE